MKILVVEDDITIAKYLKKGLEHHRFVVDVSHDGEEGLDLATSESYDVMILDRMLPGVSGTKIVKNLRDQQINTPILMLTAKGEVSDKVEGLRVGADDYLPKPFAFDELIARVQALSRRNQSYTSEIMHIKDLEINTTKGTVYRAGSLINLSKKEFELLVFLARNSGVVFTKDQLVEKVWTFDSDVLSNTAQVYIGYLRKKIDTAFDKLDPLIHTVRGFGYKLE